MSTEQMDPLNLIGAHRGMSLRWIRMVSQRDIPRAASCQALMDALPDRLHDDLRIGDVVFFPADSVILSTSGEKVGPYGDCGLLVGAVEQKSRWGLPSTYHWMVLRMNWRGADVVATDSREMRAFR